MAKLKALQDSGIDAYPVGKAPSHTVAQAIDAGDEVTRFGGRPSAAHPRLRRRCSSRSYATGPARYNCSSTIRD